jgi:hypothetical protein
MIKLIKSFIFIFKIYHKSGDFLSPKFFKFILIKHENYLIKI